jgi:hypothetical protein
MSSRPNYKVSSAALAQMLAVSQRTIQRWNKRDGYGRPSDDDRLLLVSAVHARRHEGMSVRQIVAWLVDHGYGRSVGWVHLALHNYSCSSCSVAPDVVSERQEQQDGTVQSRHVSQVNGAAP